MRIKAWTITSAAGLCAAGAGAIVVMTSTPTAVDTSFHILFWGGLTLFLWSFFATLLLFIRRSLVQALWIACVLTLGALGVLLMFRSGIHDWRLLAGVGFVTLSLSVAVWRLFRHEP